MKKNALGCFLLACSMAQPALACASVLTQSLQQSEGKPSYQEAAVALVQFDDDPALLLNAMDIDQEDPLVLPAFYLAETDEAALADRKQYGVYLTGNQSGSVRYSLYANQGGDKLWLVRLWCSAKEARALQQFSLRAYFILQCLMGGSAPSAMQFLQRMDTIRMNEPYILGNVGLMMKRDREGAAVFFFPKEGALRPEEVVTDFRWDEGFFFEDAQGTASFLAQVEALNFAEAYQQMMAYCQNDSPTNDIIYDLLTYMDDKDVFVAREHCSLYTDKATGTWRLYHEGYEALSQEVRTVPYLEKKPGEPIRIGFGFRDWGFMQEGINLEEESLREALSRLQAIQEVYELLTQMPYNWETYYQ